jgi:hypothetical protein
VAQGFAVGADKRASIASQLEHIPGIANFPLILAKGVAHEFVQINLLEAVLPTPRFHSTELQEIFD